MLTLPQGANALKEKIIILRKIMAVLFSSINFQASLKSNIYKNPLALF